MGHEWDADAAASDIAAVDQLLAGLPGHGPEERLQAMAAHFEGRYGAAEGRRRLGEFVRLCLYLDHHAAELRERGLVDADGRTLDRTFLEVLLARLAEESTVDAVPARDVQDDTVEA